MAKKPSLSTDIQATTREEDDITLNGVNKWARTTVFLTEALNANLECHALQSGESKGIIVRKALSAYLKEKGLTPNQKPRVTFTYG